MNEAVSKKPGRKTVVRARTPVSAQQLFEQIKARAQEIYNRRDPSAGDAMADWLKAEREVLAQYGK